MKGELQVALNVARSMPVEDLPRLLGDLEEIRATALARLTTPATVQRAQDELLDVDQAAQRLGISRDYIYRHSDQFPFSRRMGRRLLFSSLAIDEYLRKRK